MLSEQITEWNKGGEPIEPNEYYFVNKGGTQLYYWDGLLWWKSAKDRIGRQGYWLQKIEPQPNIKYHSNKIEIQIR